MNHLLFIFLFVLFFLSLVSRIAYNMTRERSNSQSSVKSTASRKRSTDLNKIEVYLEYPCFICGLVLGSAKSSIEHVKKIHSYEISYRPKDQVKRPRHHRFFYVRDKSGQYTITENACPSCWFHCPVQDLDCLNEHVRETHCPRRLKRKDEEEEEKDGKPKSESSEDVEMKEKEDKESKRVKFEHEDPEDNGSSVSFISKKKIEVVDESVMVDLIKSFEMFAQTLKSYTQSKSQ